MRIKLLIADIKFKYSKTGDGINDIFKLIEIYFPLSAVPLNEFHDIVKQYCLQEYGFFDEDKFTKEEIQFYQDIYYAICESYGDENKEPEEAEFFKQLLRFTYGKAESILKGN